MGGLNLGSPRLNYPAGMAELVDARDSKSRDGNIMSVRVRLPVPKSRGQMTIANCIFCAIIAQQAPAKIIDQNENIIVIEDINPKAPIHYLIIPKKHLQDIQAFSPEDGQIAADMLMMANRLSQSLDGSKAFRLVVNSGADAGQCVFHTHMHFLAGKKMAF